MSTYPGQGYLAQGYPVPPPRWGVDSVTHADYVVSGTTFFDLVTARAGERPRFWGRYIGSPTAAFNLSQSERDYLFDRRCRILLIYNGENAGSVSQQGSPGQQNGVNAANRAIASAQALGVPANGTAWIYCNIEGTWSPSTEFFNGWFTTMLASGFGPGVYGSPGLTTFNTSYCGAYNPNATRRELLYSNRRSGACDWSKRTFNPLIPPCTPRTPVYQYSMNCPVPGVQITWVQEARSSATGVTSITVTLQNAPQNGNTLIAVIVSNNNQISVSGGGVNWSPRPGDPTLSSQVNENTIIRRGGPVSGGTPTITVSVIGSPSPADICVIVSEWNGLSADIDDAVTGATNGLASPIATTPVTTRNASDLLISVGGDQGGMTPGAPASGWTAFTAPAQQPLAKIEAAYRIVSATGQYSNTWSDTGASGWDAVIAAFKAQQVDLDLANPEGFNSMWAPTRFEQFPIRVANPPVIFDGFDRSPDSGRLHAFCHDSGGTPGQFFHYYSDTDGQQWTLNSNFNLPIVPYPTAGCVGWPPPRVDGRPQLQQQLQAYQQANPGHQVDICYDTFEVVSTSGCEAFNYVPNVAFAASPDGRGHAFYHQYHSRREATVSWTYATGYLCDRFYTSESSCTHCGNPTGRQVGTPVPNVLQGSTGTDTLFQFDQYMLHSKTATDGVTWDGSMDIIDETHFDRLNGVGDDGLGYGDFEVRCDDNSVPYFAWSYDGFRRSPGIANSEEAVYFRKGATGAKETVDIQSGNSTNYRRVMPHVAPDIATGKTLVMWRAVTSGQFPASPDHLYYKVRSNAGAFGARQTFFDDTAQETTDTNKLHPTGAGSMKMVHSTTTGSGSTLTYNLYRADFNFVTEGFGVRTSFYQKNVGTNGSLWYGSSLDGSKTKLKTFLTTLVAGIYAIYLFDDAVSGGLPRVVWPALPGDFRLVTRSFWHGVNLNFVDGTLQNYPASYMFGIFYGPPIGTTSLYLGRIGSGV